MRAASVFATPEWRHLARCDVYLESRQPELCSLRQETPFASPPPSCRLAGAGVSPAAEAYSWQRH